MSGKSLEELTELPKGLGRFWPTLEEFKADLKLAVDSSDRSNWLMAQLLTPMTSKQAEEVKAEIKGITDSMNDILGKRLDGQKGIVKYVAMMAFAEYMSEYGVDPNRHLTKEQVDLLMVTGVFDELMTSGK